MLRLDDEGPHHPYVPPEPHASLYAPASMPRGPDFSEAAVDGTDFRSLRVLSYGSAPMPLPVIREAIDRFPASVGFMGKLRRRDLAALFAPRAG